MTHVRGELQRMWDREHTPHETAASFAFGTFVVIMPTLVFGLVLFGYMAVRMDRVNAVALFAPTVVFNPFVKTPLYSAGYTVGAVLVGTPTVTETVLGVAVVGATVQFAAGIVVVAAATAAASYGTLRGFARLSR